jgi:hypothetical protein
MGSWQGPPSAQLYHPPPSLVSTKPSENEKKHGEKKQQKLGELFVEDITNEFIGFMWLPSKQGGETAKLSSPFGLTTSFFFHRRPGLFTDYPLVN